MAWVPGEELTIKIWDSLTRSIGGWCSPWQIRRTGKANNDVLADQKIKLAIAEKIIQKMDSGAPPIEIKGNILEIYQSQILPATQTPLKEIPEIVSENQIKNFDQGMPDFMKGLPQSSATRIVRRELQREINLRQIAIIANEEASSMKDEPISENPVAPDWMAQWLNLAQDISDELFQVAMAKALARENQKPGSCSLRTLDFLRTASKDILEKFQKLCSYYITTATFNYESSKFEKESSSIFRNDFITSETKPGTYMGMMDLEALLELEEEGLVSLNGGNVILRTFNHVLRKVDGETHMVPDLKGAIIYGEELITFKPKQIMVGTKISIPIFNLSKVGKDLAGLGKFTTNQQVKDAIIKKLNESCIVTVLPA